MKLEEKFGKIEDIINKLENNDIGLDEAFKIYNDGMKLVKECGDSIDKVEKKLTILTEQ